MTKNTASVQIEDTSRRAKILILFKTRKKLDFEIIVKKALIMKNEQYFFANLDKKQLLKILL
jgi:hypothetical protein